MEMDNLMDFTRGKGDLSEKKSLHALTCITTFLHHQPATFYTPIGSSFFTPSNSSNIPGGLSVWRGYHQVGI